ncbi:MAG: hypothetical protein N2316_08260 [Spirochaetes bacterium]|nr:hypothetical protein [Spirochaetota bacterium]
MEFTITNILQSSFQRSVKYLVPVIVNTILWIVTLWIPYLNVGTTIGLWIGISAKMSKGEEISMAEIFNPQYRRYMGEFFLVTIFIISGVLIGWAFLFIPGIVIALSWMLAPLYVIDRGMTPTDAISKSNQVTYGKKWTIFISFFLIGLIWILALILGTIIFSNIPEIGGFLAFIWIFGASVLFSVIDMAAASVIYGELNK